METAGVPNNMTKRFSEISGDLRVLWIPTPPRGRVAVVVVVVVVVVVAAAAAAVVVVVVVVLAEVVVVVVVVAVLVVGLVEVCQPRVMIRCLAHVFSSELLVSLPLSFCAWRLSSYHVLLNSCTHTCPDTNNAGLTMATVCWPCLSLRFD